MIKYISYSMFDAFDNSRIQTVVNTINCMGIMGKGLAFEFKTRYPEMYKDYVARFKKDELKIGEPYIFKTGEKWIVNFPTKNHWRYPSQIEFIDSGLNFFTAHYKKWGIRSVAFPRLGCTSGNLDWSQVKPIMERHLSNLKDIDIYIFLDEDISNKEKELVRIFNEGDRDTLRTNIKLTDKQIVSLKDHIKIRGALKRIRDLLKIKSIGPVAYKRALARHNAPITIQGEFCFS